MKNKKKLALLVALSIMAGVVGTVFAHSTLIASRQEAYWQFGERIGNVAIYRGNVWGTSSDGWHFRNYNSFPVRVIFMGRWSMGSSSIFIRANGTSDWQDTLPQPFHVRVYR